MIRKKTEFKVIKASHGDCLLIKTFKQENEEFVILIDGGPANTFLHSLKNELEKLSKIDLLVLTHIDDDHIGGLIQLFKNSILVKIEIKEIWVNHPDLIEGSTGELISFRQGNNFKDLILEKSPLTSIRNICTEDKKITFNGLIFTILSPTKEIVNELYEKWEMQKLKSAEIENISVNIGSYETGLLTLSKEQFLPQNTIGNDLINASSISFLLECPDISILLLADSRAEIIENELKLRWKYTKEKPLNCNYVKISHHGSKNNTSCSLLELINSTAFIISTNGGKAKHKHPSRETIARIVYCANRNNNNDKIIIYTNYPIEDIKARIGNFITSSDLTIGNWEMLHKNDF